MSVVIDRLFSQNDLNASLHRTCEAQISYSLLLTMLFFFLQNSGLHNTVSFHDLSGAFLIQPARLVSICRYPDPSLSLSPGFESHVELVELKGSGGLNPPAS